MVKVRARDAEARRAASAATDRPARLGPDDYIAVGRRLLAEGGIGAVTIANVCAQLRVTKGSFYHHFDSGPAFHAALLADYEDEYGRRRLREVDAVDGLLAQLDALVTRGVERDHEGESAIRAWSRVDPVAAEVVGRVDAARITYLTDLFASRGMPVEQAGVHAAIAMSIVAGAQAMRRVTDRAQVEAMLLEHSRWIVASIEQASIGTAR